MSVWEKVARFCQEVYGSHIDWEERFYICGECGEPMVNMEITILKMVKALFAPYVNIFMEEIYNG